VFGEFANMLRHSFGDLVVLEDDNYPPPPLNQLAATILQVAVYGGAFVALVAGNLLPQTARQWLQENRMMVIAAAFLGHSIAGMLIQTGAFEVYVDGQLIFSKLETNRTPQLSHLMQLVEQQIRQVNSAAQ
jgi:selT/selW/selH-like putative selenoprotein